MPIVNQHFQPEHGLQIEETHEAGDQVGVYHLFRYWYAWAFSHQRLVKDDVVWDLGCGSAYGSRILSEQHEWSVVGLDNDSEALKASEEYSDQPDLSVLPADLDGDGLMNFSDRPSTPPTMIVCYDLLSFLSHRDVFLQTLNHIAGIRGAPVLFSTQIGAVSRYVDTSPRWKEKKIEYSHEAITNLLSHFFDRVLIVGDAHFPLQEYRQKICDYAGYPVGEDIIVCEGPR